MFVPKNWDTIQAVQTEEYGDSQNVEVYLEKSWTCNCHSS